MNRETKEGRIVMVAGPVIKASSMTGTRMYDVVMVGEERLIGEVIGLEGDVATIQVYEETGGLRPGEPVYTTGSPLAVELGPGIVGMIYDGIQRPLELIMDKTGDYIRRGVHVDALSRERKHHFAPTVKVGEKVTSNSILGVVQETPVVEHRVMVPPGVVGEVTFVVDEGDYTVEEVVAKVRTPSGQERELTMMQRWPVRVARPFAKKHDPEIPLITGQRVLDTFFPIAKGGTAAIPGGFGTGKTVTQHQLAKWCDAEIIVYIGCGERGNEMTDVLKEFPKLVDPRSGEPLMNRTVLIANTSNMPVAAREASVYTGITIAEYFRDMGYHVALMADSTSRWAEAMREISGRLEEMPGEEGYPAYLASRLANFYERAGLVEVGTTDGRVGSVSVIGAVSPPGGDFSEPVTQNTLRIVKVFWALDAKLADRRHFPSINWLKSYSLYLKKVSPWWMKNVAPDWYEKRQEAMRLLQEESELQEIIQLVGPDAIPPAQQVVLETARMLREDFLQQNAFHEVDTFCPEKKQYRMLDIILKFHHMAEETLGRGIPVESIKAMKIREDIARMARVPNDTYEKVFDEIEKRMAEEFKRLS
ncbi:MAG TPA: ATP synthase subunit A [Euryarchaeota archaeon]|nr:MAG: ATP synthase subunit A [Thermoplasmata archaeon]HDD59551.1 ATP synthase subunit A [Euryarchaeota archaeon]